jgi:hypothetical protein
MAEDLLDRETMGEMIALQKGELTVRQYEIQMQSEHLANHKEVALRTIEAEEKNAAQQRN